MPINAIHDIQCFAYLIKHKEIGLCLFQTDSFYSPFKFKGLNQIIIELNYDDETLENNIISGKTNFFVRNRVIRSHTGLSTLKKFLLENDLSKINNIVLIHLSSQNSNAERFKKEIEQLTGKNVKIAQKGLKCNFNIQPF